MQLAWVIPLIIVSADLYASVRQISYRDGKENFVQQIFNEADHNVAVLQLKNKNFAREGNLLNVYRWARSNETGESVKIKTGEIKIKSAYEGMILGVVTYEGGAVSQAIFRDHPGVMAGDEVEMKSLQIVAKKMITPEMTIRYEDLFSNPSRFNQSFELSVLGEEALASVSEAFGGLRKRKLIIEGHTGSLGDSTDNQLESLKRAQAIKHVLVDKFGFDSDRLIALGFGETEPEEDVYYPGVERVNRRIVIRVSHE